MTDLQGAFIFSFQIIDVRPDPVNIGGNGMSSAMNELFAVTGLFDDVANGIVNFGAKNITFSVLFRQIVHSRVTRFGYNFKYVTVFFGNIFGRTGKTDPGDISIYGIRLF